MLALYGFSVKKENGLFNTVGPFYNLSGVLLGAEYYFACHLTKDAAWVEAYRRWSINEKRILNKSS